MIGQNCCLTLHPPTNWKRPVLKPFETWNLAPNTRQPFNPETVMVGAKFPNLSSSPPAQRTVDISLFCLSTMLIRNSNRQCGLLYVFQNVYWLQNSQKSKCAFNIYK